MATDGARAGTLGNLEEFDPKSDTMAAYLERAAFYMDANHVADEKKTATLLTAIGKSTFQVLRNLVAPAKVKDKTFDEIADVLLKHYEPKPLVMGFSKTQTGPGVHGPVRGPVQGPVHGLVQK